jgi:phage shock protein PspC (stress-responsive transcriptional regulator)
MGGRADRADDAPVTDTTSPPPTGEPGPVPPAPGPGSPRRLTRSRDDRVLGGVAAGIARYFAVDPIVIRIFFVVAAVFAGVGVLAYVAGWLLLPEEDAPRGPVKRVDWRQLAGCVLLGVGLLVTLGRFGFWIDEQVVWALGLIGIGGAVLWLRGRDTRSGEVASPPWSAPPDPTAPATPSAPIAPVAPTDPTVPSTPWPYPTAPTTPRWGAGPIPPLPPRGPDDPSAPWTRARRRPPKPARQPSALGILSFCLLLIGGGIVLGLASSDVIDVSAAAVLGGAVAFIGATLVLGAWWGRAKWLIVPAVALSLVAAGLSALDVPLGGGIGERDHHPRRVAAVDDSYELGIGSLKLDLRDVDFSGRTKSVDASIGIGELKVWVPDDVRVVIDEELSAGVIDNFADDDPDDGTGLDRHVVRPGVEGGGRLHLELRGGIGAIKVEGNR